MSTQLAIDAEEAARRLGIASSTLAKLRQKGAGPAFCKLGRRVVYRLADLESYLAAHQRQSTKQNRRADLADRHRRSRKISI
jgi:hypothetical protein